MGAKEKVECMGHSLRLLLYLNLLFSDTSRIVASCSFALRVWITDTNNASQQLVWPWTAVGLERGSWKSMVWTRWTWGRDRYTASLSTLYLRKHYTYKYIYMYVYSCVYISIHVFSSLLSFRTFRLTLNILFFFFSLPPRSLTSFSWSKPIKFWTLS